MINQAVKEKDLTSLGEKTSYGGWFIGQHILYSLVAGYLIPVFTDVGLPALTVAGIALVVKVWDAANDPIFGGIVDKIRFKKGRFLPWLRLSLIFIPISVVLLFSVPSGISLNLKVIWVVIAYMLWDTSYTMCDVPAYGIVTTMTDRQYERTKIQSFGRIAAGTGGFFVSIGVPLFRNALGGWRPMVLAFSAVALFTMIPLCFKGKERFAAGGEFAAGVKQEGVSVKEMFRFLTGNKYLLIYWGAFMISGLVGIGGLSMFFYRYNLGDEKLGGVLNIIRTAPSLLFALMVPIVCKKFDKFKLFYWGKVASVVLGLVRYFVGYKSFALIVVFEIISIIPYQINGMLQFMFTPDCIEYGKYKTGVDASGVALALQTFSIKLLGAVGTAVGALALALIGFVEGEGAVQLPGFADKIWFLMRIPGIIGTVLGLLLLTRYKLTDKKVSIMIKANNGEITREEADASLGNI
jgi:sugar (glycoside-pentoside-hexuronide) transporter